MLAFIVKSVLMAIAGKWFNKFNTSNMVDLKLVFIIPLIILSTCKGFSQQYSEDRKTFFLNENKSYMLVEDTADLTKVHIHVSNKVNNEFIVQKSIELNIASQNADFVSFGPFIYKTRRFILIYARYSFFIINLYNDKIIGPVGSRFYGVRDDSQSGMLSGLKIIFDGRFIIGYSVDNGAFLIDLTNLYQPTESRTATNPFASENRVFIIDSFEKPGRHFGILVTAKDWEAEYKLLFTNKKIEDFEHPLLNREINDRTLLDTNFDLIDYYYTILKEKISDVTYQYIIYENSTGNQIELPASIDKSDKTQVIKYLQSKEK